MDCSLRCMACTLPALRSPGCSALAEVPVASLALALRTARRPAALAYCHCLLRTSALPDCRSPITTTHHCTPTSGAARSAEVRSRSGTTHCRNATRLGLLAAPPAAKWHYCITHYIPPSPAPPTPGGAPEACLLHPRRSSSTYRIDCHLPHCAPRGRRIATPSEFELGSSLTESSPSYTHTDTRALYI